MAYDKLPMDSGESFLCGLEQGQADGDCDYIGANLPRLEKLSADLQGRILELVRLLDRAKRIYERHEPPAEKRVKRKGQ